MRRILHILHNLRSYGCEDKINRVCVALHCYDFISLPHHYMTIRVMLDLKRKAETISSCLSVTLVGKRDVFVICYHTQSTVTFWQLSAINLAIVNVCVIIMLSIGNAQISILLLCFLYLFVELMITMNEYFLFLFKPKHCGLSHNLSDRYLIHTLLKRYELAFSWNKFNFVIVVSIHPNFFKQFWLLKSSRGLGIW